MTYQEKNITVSLSSAILILGYYLLRLFQMSQSGTLDSASVFRLWGIVIAATILVNIVGMILAHILSAVAQAIQTQQEPEIEDIEDERDGIIKLKGTRVAYIVSSFGVFISMLTLVFGKPPLVMFSLLIFFGIFSGIVGDISRLIFSRRGM
jgi:uncharacterized membrane protein